MKWFRFRARKDSPTRYVSKSEHSSRKSSGPRSAAVRGDGTSGHSGSRRRRRTSHSTSLPRDMSNRSYYAPTQRNFYPPNLIRPPTKTVTPYAGYFQGGPRGQEEYEENLAEDYAQELYRNQFLFFRPKNKKSVNNAPYLGMETGYDNGSRQPSGVVPGQFGDNSYRHSAPSFPSQFVPVQAAGRKGNWNWGFQQQQKPPIQIISVRRVRANYRGDLRTNRIISKSYRIGLI